MKILSVKIGVRKGEEMRLSGLWCGGREGVRVKRLKKK